MPFTVTENTGIPAGTYTGMLEAVSETTISSEFGKDQEMFRWDFQVNVNGALQPINALSTKRIGPGSKTRKWLEALLRRPLLVGETIDDPVGANALIVIGPNKKGYSSILDVLPAPQHEEVLPGVPR
jgi:hypothetical protein